MAWATSSPGMAISKAPPGAELDGQSNGAIVEQQPDSQRKRVVVVGLGMVGIAFMWVQSGNN